MNLLIDFTPSLHSMLCFTFIHKCRLMSLCMWLLMMCRPREWTELTANLVPLLEWDWFNCCVCLRVRSVSSWPWPGVSAMLFLIRWVFPGHFRLQRECHYICMFGRKNGLTSTMKWNTIAISVAIVAFFLLFKLWFACQELVCLWFALAVDIPTVAASQTSLCLRSEKKRSLQHKAGSFVAAVAKFLWNSVLSQGHCHRLVGLQWVTGFNVTCRQEIQKPFVNKSVQ